MLEAVTAAAGTAILSKVLDPSHAFIPQFRLRGFATSFLRETLWVSVQRPRRLRSGQTAPGQRPQCRRWEELPLPEIERQQQRGKVVMFRADAAFAKPELHAALEERNMKYAIRLPSNDNLERHVAKLLTRSVGRSSYKPVVRLKSFLYQADPKFDRQSDA
jgi:hypothetical protein